MSLTTILKEIETNKPHAEMDITMGSPQTYGSRVGVKRAAIETIKRLKVQYRDELLASTVFIVVTGSSKDTFAELASGDTFGCFSVDSEAFYKDLASRVSPPTIKPALWGRESTGSLFSIAQNVLRDMASDLDIESYPALMYSDKYNTGVTSVEDFAQLIKKAVNDQVGTEIVGINAVHSVVDKAIDKKHSAIVTPVILSTSDENFALDLSRNLKSHRLSDGTLRGLTKNVFLVVAGKASKTFKPAEAIVVKTIAEESVGEALTTIKNKVL